MTEAPDLRTPSRAPSHARRNAPHSDNRLPTILDAAAQLFRRKGYRVTSMRDIAAASGMLAGSLYYHFASKEELLVAVYAEGVRRISVSVRAALARDRRSVGTARSRVCRAPGGAARGQRLRAGRHPRAPGRRAGCGRRLIALRDDYERLFAQALPSCRWRSAPTAGRCA